MRRLCFRILKLLPVSGLLLVGTCGVTDRQFSDFFVSTGIRVFVQTMASVLQAGIIAGQG